VFEEFFDDCVELAPVLPEHATGLGVAVLADAAYFVVNGWPSCRPARR
jgi:hypothetical protein